MEIDPRLLIHAAGYLAGAAINVVLAIFVAWKTRKNRSAFTWTFICMTLSVAVFQLSHVLGTMAANAEASRFLFMFNLANIGIGIWMAHWFLALIGKAKQKRIALGIIYATGTGLFLLYVLYPATFLVASVPKLYFPFYYEPGRLYWLMRTWFNLVALYYFYQLFRAYRETSDPLLRNRYKYVFASIITAFVVGSSAVFLIYNIPVDPLISMFFGVCTIPLAYTIVQYELMDIRVVAKRALFYAVSVSALAVLINFLNFSNQWIIVHFPHFPTWIIPLLSSCAAVSVGVFVWNRTKETDILKYEFITVITHKFRTPLTRIKWSAENLTSGEKDPLKKEELSTIQSATTSLVELTNTLVTLADTDNLSAGYQYKKVDLGTFVHEVMAEYQPRFLKKGIQLIDALPRDITVSIDRDKMQFVIQTLLDNAFAYTSAGGQVRIALAERKKDVLLTVSDTGIGISRADLSRVFTKFFRTSSAASLDTEGMGIGLFMVKTIIARHGGKIWVQSEGQGKGSTFFISLNRA